MKCPKCGADNPKGAKFCNQCATPLTVQQDKRMQIVKNTIPKTMRSKILSTHIEGERKNVTVLFADVSGFTKLSEKLDPEELTDIINKLFKVLIEVVYENEGTIDKLIGDCIMALFGAPITHEDDPERAVNTALKILGALDLFNSEQKTNLSIHIGINSGLVIVGGVGSDLKMDYTVMGDTVNCAERLMEIAEDEILVSESVYKKSSYLFEMTPLENVTVKGKNQQITPYRVIGTKEEPKRKRGIPGLHSPLVGREKEYTSLLSSMDSLLNGKSQVLSVIGETGVGKSRLIEELNQYGGNRMVWLKGRTLSYGKHFPFRVFLEQIRSYVGISKFDSQIKAREKLKSKSKELFKDDTDEYFPYLCHFLSIRVPEPLQEKIKYLTPENLKLQASVAVKTFLKKITEEKPVVLYFEDMHLIDPESLELTKFLLDGLKKEPILFLFETRPEKTTGLYKIRDYAQKLYRKGYKEVILHPLQPEDAKALVRNLLNISSYPEQLSPLILEKSEGNPFYIEEIIGTLIDSNVLKIENGVCSNIPDITKLEVPDTIEAVIRARIDKLPQEAKELLGRASVIGRTFSHKLLSYVSEKSKIDSSLQILEKRQFISKSTQESKTSTYEIEYTFTHILTRDICYKGLLKKKRRYIHKKIAQGIESMFSEKIEDHYRILALHYLNAKEFKKSYNFYRKAGDIEKEFYRNDSSIECYTKAIEIHKNLFPEQNKAIAPILEKRGDVKELKAEYDSALKDFEEALNLYENPTEKAKMEKKIGNIFHNRSDYDTAIPHYQKAVKMLKKTPESPLLAETLIDYGALLSHGKSDYEAAEKTIEQALTKISKKNEPGSYAQGLEKLGGVFSRRGDYERALKYQQEALAIREVLQDKRGISVGYTNIGALYLKKGQLDKSLTYHKKSLGITKEIGYKKGIGRAYRNIGLVYKVKGENETALKYYERCLQISEEIGNKSGIAAAFFNMGHIYLSGELDTALKYYKKSLAISEEIGNKSAIGQVANNIGIVYRNKGEPTTALKYYKQYLSIAEETKDKWAIGAATGNIGAVYHDIGTLDEALEYGKRSLELFENIGYKGGIGLTSDIIGKIYMDMGDTEQALNFFNKHLQISQEIGIKKEISRAYLSIGSLYTESKNIKQARDCLEKSEKIIKQIEGKIDLSDIYIAYANLYITMENYEKAVEFAEKGFFNAKNTGAKTSEIIALRTIGKALFQSSKKRKGKEAKEIQQKASSYLEESLSLSENQEMRLNSGKSLYELGKLMHAMGRIEDSERYLKRASEIFKKSGTKHWFEKVKEIL
jgi:predicted ATPase/class 3 adenylate cyclase